MTPSPLLMHIGRCSLWTALLVLALPYPPLAAAAAAMLFFQTFSFFHDAAHGALGMPTAANDLVLFLTSAPLMMSAHGQRQLHLRHHARPLADDDLEGEGALQSLVQAALRAPLASVHMRVASFSVVNQRVRPWVVMENLLNLTSGLAVVWSGNLGLQTAFLVAMALQLTMNAWASHVPHRAPRWLLAGAAKLEWTRSPVVLALVYHLEHHAQPRLPCAQLHARMDVHSPLTWHNEARPEKLPWAQLQTESRPRPLTRV